MQFRVIVVTDPQTNKHTQTDVVDYNTLRRSLVRSVIKRDKPTGHCDAVIGTAVNEQFSSSSGPMVSMDRRG